MIEKKSLVERAISFGGSLPYLPKGELFIQNSFLDALFPPSDNYFSKLKQAIPLLELDLIGIFPVEKMEDITKTDTFRELKNLFLVCNIYGPFSFWTQHLGFLETLKALRKDKKTLFNLSENLLNNIKIKLPLYREYGFDGVAIIDDIAGNDGVFFSMVDFKTLLEPVYRRMAEIIKSCGLFLFFHSDGNLEKYLIEFLNMGIDCFNTCDTQAGMNIYRMRESLTKRVCFMGHIDLFEWNAGRIISEIKKAEKTFSGGGLILGSSSGLCERSLKKDIHALYPGLKVRIKNGEF